MSWSNIKDVPEHLRPLGLAKANRWSEIYEALRAGGASEQVAATTAWVRTRSGPVSEGVVVNGVRFGSGRRVTAADVQTSDSPPVDVAESGRRNSAEDRERIATVARNALDQMDDEQFESFLAALPGRRRPITVRPANYLPETGAAASRQLVEEESVRGAAPSTAADFAETAAAGLFLMAATGRVVRKRAVIEALDALGREFALEGPVGEAFEALRAGAVPPRSLLSGAHAALKEAAARLRGSGPEKAPATAVSEALRRARSRQRPAIRYALRDGLTTRLD